jgi:DNA repair protein RadC
MITLKTSDRTPHLAELKVTYKRGRRRRARGDDPPRVLNSAARAEEYLRAVWDEDTLDLREEFVVLCLDASLSVIGWVRLHTGGLDSSPVDPRLVFAVALQTASAAIVVAHNHPSGNVEPSEHDAAITRRLSQGAKLLGIRLLDHLILGRSSCYSFADAGKLAE